MDVIKQYYLQEMGIPLWTVRQSQKARQSLQALSNHIQDCEYCRSLTSIGKGCTDAHTMIVADNPNDIDSPLFHNMLKSLALQTDEIYISFVQRCPKHLKEQVLCINPERLWLLGDIAHVEDLHPRCVLTCSPTYLMKHPKDKKLVYQNLSMWVANR